MKSVTEYEKLRTNSNYLKLTKSPMLDSKKLIVSPSLQSKFSPSITISKSPLMTKRVFKTEQHKDARSFLSNLASRNPEKANPLLKYTGKGKNPNNIVPEEELDENVGNKNIPVFRKGRTLLRNLEAVDKPPKDDMFPAHNIEDMPIKPAIKFKPQGLLKSSREDVNSLTTG